MAPGAFSAGPHRAYLSSFSLEAMQGLSPTDVQAALARVVPSGNEIGECCLSGWDQAKFAQIDEAAID